MYFVIQQDDKISISFADDPDVNDSSGTRYGNVKFSRSEYGSLPGRHRQKSDLSLDFKTTEPDGIIYYAADSQHTDFTTLYLKDGKVSFAFFVSYAWNKYFVLLYFIEPFLWETCQVLREFSWVQLPYTQ